MKFLLQHVIRRSAEFAQHPLFGFTGDSSLDPRRRLRFAPYLAHFVMTFADLYRYVLPEHPPRDRYQELVNIHVSEDETHWKWFLADLGKLDLDPPLPLSDALRFVWADSTLRSRMLSYQVCRLGFGADSLRKLVIVLVIEAAGRVALGSFSRAGRDVGVRGRLVYFGVHHIDSEADHTLEEAAVRADLERIDVGDATREGLTRLADEMFGYFAALADEALAFAAGAERNEHVPAARESPWT